MEQAIREKKERIEKGNMSIYLSNYLREKLEQEAVKENRSVSGQISTILKKYYRNLEI